MTKQLDLQGRRPNPITEGLPCPRNVFNSFRESSIMKIVNKITDRKATNYKQREERFQSGTCTFTVLERR
jgi:hypothetical protein